MQSAIAAGPGPARPALSRSSSDPRGQSPFRLRRAGDRHRNRGGTRRHCPDRVDWMLTDRLVQDQGAEIRERTEQALAGQAATMSETIAHEMQMIDKVCRSSRPHGNVTATASTWCSGKRPCRPCWACPKTFSSPTTITSSARISFPKRWDRGVWRLLCNVPAWRARNLRTQRHQEQGVDVAAGRRRFAGRGAPVPDVHRQAAGSPENWLIGASYRSTELTELFAQAALGFNPVVALVDTQNGACRPLSAHPRDGRKPTCRRRLFTPP